MCVRVRGELHWSVKFVTGIDQSEGACVEVVWG